jgi:hypothetical protein
MTLLAVLAVTTGRRGARPASASHVLAITGRRRCVRRDWRRRGDLPVLAAWAPILFGAAAHDSDGEDAVLDERSRDQRRARSAQSSAGKSRYSLQRTLR